MVCAIVPLPPQGSSYLPLGFVLVSLVGSLIHWLSLVVRKIKICSLIQTNVELRYKFAFNINCQHWDQH